MNNSFEVKPIGKVKHIDGRIMIKLNDAYWPGLHLIDGFSHLQILWWAHLINKAQYRENLIAENLFKNGPGKIGIFGTRSPARPNPIMISTIEVDRIDREKGLIYTPYIDAAPDTPVLDIKPYFPMERVRKCAVPKWCEHWPQWAEDAVAFNWKNEIDFD